MSVALNKINPGDWDAVQLNTDITAKSLRQPLPQARVYNNANLSVPNNTVTALTFNSERWDNGGLHSTSANTGRLTAPITGLYSIGCSVQWALNAVGARLVRVVLNGATPIGRDIRPAATGIETEQGVAFDHRLVAGDFVTVEALQTSGGALNVTFLGNTTPEFWMHRIGGYTNEGIA